MTLPAVLIVHNHYRSGAPSGENRSFADERDLLVRAGHRVSTYERRSDELEGASPRGRAGAAATAVWSRRTRREVAALIARERPDVVHVQNHFPLISASVYAACRDAGVPVVQALRNYRFACLNGLLLREGRPCNDCVGRAPLPGLRHACYRGERAASAAAFAMVATHRAAGTWARGVDVFVAPSAFARQVAIDGGLPADRIVVKPNLVHPDPGPGAHTSGGAVFAGRLSPEKGLGTLLTAWEKLGGAAPPLTIAGDGPLAPLVRDAAARLERVTWVGALAPDRVGDLIADAAFLVAPSLAFETFGRTVMEAAARATPAIVTDHGALAELVDDGVSGLLVEPGDAGALADAVARLAEDPRACRAMGDAARAGFAARCTAEANHRMLLEIYALAGAGR